MKKFTKAMVIGTALLATSSTVFAQPTLCKQKMAISSHTATAKGATVVNFPIYYNNERKLMTAPVITLNNTTYVPLRAVGTILGAKVDYEAPTKVASTTMQDTTLEFPISYNFAIRNNAEMIHIPTGVVLYKNTAYLPLRVISEQFDHDVTFKNKTIYINSKGTPVAPTEPTKPEQPSKAKGAHDAAFNKYYNSTSIAKTQVADGIKMTNNHLYIYDSFDSAYHHLQDLSKQAVAGGNYDRMLWESVGIITEEELHQRDAENTAHFDPQSYFKEMRYLGLSTKCPLSPFGKKNYKYENDYSDTTYLLFQPNTTVDKLTKEHFGLTQKQYDYVLKNVLYTHLTAKTDYEVMQVTCTLQEIPKNIIEISDSNVFTDENTAVATHTDGSLLEHVKQGAYVINSDGMMLTNEGKGGEFYDKNMQHYDYLKNIQKYKANKVTKIVQKVGYLDAANKVHRGVVIFNITK